jgi:hypothetical protein
MLFLFCLPHLSKSIPPGTFSTTCLYKQVAFSFPPLQATCSSEVRVSYKHE